MPAPTPTSALTRQRLDGPQIGEGIWSVYEDRGACIVHFTTVKGDVNGIEFITAPAGSGPYVTVQGADTNINLNLSGKGTGRFVMVGPLEVTGPVTFDSTLHVVGAVTLDSTLDVLGAVNLHSTLLVQGATTLQAAVTQSGGTASFDSPTLVVNETAHLVGIGVVPAAGGAKLDVTGGYIRALDGATAAPSTGAGVEIVSTGGVGFIDAFNRATATTLELNINANPLKLNVGSAALVTIGGAASLTSTLTVTGLTTLNGALSVTGNITLSGALVFTAATGQVIPGATSWNVLNAGQTRNNLSILDSGNTTIQGPLTVVTGGVTVTAGGLTLVAGDLTLANAQLKRGTDTWTLVTGLGSDQLVQLTATQSMSNKTLGTGLKILIGGDATGDMYYNGGSGTVTRIAIGASTTVMVGGSSPGWAQVDRTRVVLTTATGIMTLHDVQTKDAEQTFTGQLIAGVSGTGTHKLVVASGTPSGATLTAAELGIYGSVNPTLMIRETTDNVEGYWQAYSVGVNEGTLTNHPLNLVTNNVIRCTIAAGGGITATGDFEAATVMWKGLRSTAAGQGSLDVVATAANTGALVNCQNNIWAAGNPGPANSVNVNKWLKANIGAAAYWIPLYV